MLILMLMCCPGTLVLIHGEVVHKSEHNYSDKSREIYTFHMYDHAQASYDDKNWSVSAVLCCPALGDLVLP